MQKFEKKKTEKDKLSEAEIERGTKPTFEPVFRTPDAVEEFMVLGHSHLN